MGADKAEMNIGGMPQVVRIADGLAGDGWEVTVLGGSPIRGHAHRADDERLAGPLAALRGFVLQPWPVFVCSCDLPLFRPLVASALLGRLGAVPVVPVVGGRPQPLCALYPASAFATLRANPGWVRVTDWLQATGSDLVDEEGLQGLGLDPVWVANANTPAEFAALVGRLETPVQPATN